MGMKLGTGVAVSIETRLRAGRPGFDFRQVQWWNCFILATAMSRPVLGPTQLPIQWNS